MGLPGFARYQHLWWHEEDITFYFELDDEGYALRHVERDASGRFTSAASRAEWNRQRDYGDLYEYMEHWGSVAEGNLTEGEIPEPSFARPITREQFETIWDEAREARSSWWQSTGRSMYEAATGDRPSWRPLKG